MLLTACDGNSRAPSAEALVVSCPSPPAVSSPNPASVVVTYPAPTVTGGAAPVTVTCTPPSGAAFALGTSAVTCIATDTKQQTVAVMPPGQRTVRTSPGVVGLWGASVSANTFALLRVGAMLGRTLGAGDEAQPDVVVLSFGTWQRHFRADPAVLGSTIEMRSGALQPPRPARLLTVVGVLPADFEFPTGTFDFYTPILLDGSTSSPRVTTIGRLAPGVSFESQETAAIPINAVVAFDQWSRRSKCTSRRHRSRIAALG